MHRLLLHFFSPRGRLRRATFLWSLIALILVFAASFALMEKFGGRASTLLLYPPFLWSAFALMAKRLHDRDSSAWWLLVAIVPVLGPLWLFVMLGLRGGSKGENRHGPDPRTIDADYLTVKISP